VRDAFARVPLRALRAAFCATLVLFSQRNRSRSFRWPNATGGRLADVIVAASNAAGTGTDVAAANAAAIATITTATAITASHDPAAYRATASWSILIDVFVECTFAPARSPVLVGTAVSDAKARSAPSSLKQAKSVALN
jgi:hypothetical protein